MAWQGRWARGASVVLSSCMKSGGRWRCRDALRRWQAAAISTQKRCRAGQKGSGASPQETEGGASQEWERSGAGEEEGREAARPGKSERANNEGGRDRGGKGGPHLAPSSSTPRTALCLPCGAARNGRGWEGPPNTTQPDAAAEHPQTEHPDPRGFSRSGKFCSEGGSAKGPGCASHQQPRPLSPFPKMRLG